MHTNHRRPRKFQAKHHNRQYLLAYSLKWYRRQKAKDRRALERQLMAHERYDDFPNRYPRCIYWEYW